MKLYSSYLHQAATQEAASNKDIPFYRGVPKGATASRPNAMGLIFVSPNREEAQMFSDQSRGKIVECRVNTDNIFEGWNPEHLERIGLDGGETQEHRLFDSAYVEDPFYLDKIRSAGFDGFYVRDYPLYPPGFMNIALFGSEHLS